MDYVPHDAEPDRAGALRARPKARRMVTDTRKYDYQLLLSLLGIDVTGVTGVYITADARGGASGTLTIVTKKETDID